MVGQHGATGRGIRHRHGTCPQLGRDLHVAVLLAGVNDVLSRRGPEEWGEDLAVIVGDLAVRAEAVVLTGIPPFAEFPLLPTSLGRYLSQRPTALDKVSQQVCAEQPQETWISSTGFAPADSLMHAGQAA